MLCMLALQAQNDPRIARTKTALSEVPTALMPPMDNEALLAAEMSQRGPGIAPKFAVPIEVDISTATSGRWEQLSDGNALWRLRIRSAGAKSLNLGFTKYFMPARGSLILYSPDYQTVMGPFTPADNEEHEELWTPVFPGDEVVVEVQVPGHLQPQLQLELGYVNHDFLGFFEVASGSCNLDVICGAADGWAIVDKYRDIIQSVAVISTGGVTFCTGFLVNNARQDCTPYFMTANHCDINANNDASLVTYWNFFNSTCRQPNTPASGGNGNGQLNDFNTGSTVRATYASSDFTLVELDDPVSETANAFFAGWSAEDFAPTDTVIAIHHPNTDEKRISFEFDPTFIANYSSETPNPNGTHLTVPDWDIGTTEGGSSGSPLFNRQKRVVGQLHGGFAACGNNDLDSYGWFYRSWTGGGSPSSRLKDWLDPDNTGIIVLDGRSQELCSYYVEGSPSIQSLCVPADAVYTINVSPNFTAAVSLSVPNLPAGLTANFENNPVPPGTTTTLTIGNTAGIAEGDYTFVIEATDGTANSNSSLQLVLASQVPVAPAAILPAPSTTSVGLMPKFNWVAVPNVKYTIEVATDPDFANIIETATNLTGGTYQSTVTLNVLTNYYWRVRGENVCGLGDWPAQPYDFKTGLVTCAPFSSTNVPVNIPSSGAPTVTSTLNITNTGLVEDVNVSNLFINHTFVGDLRVELQSPSGTTVVLFENPGNGGCNFNNVQVSLDDEAALTNNDLLAMCNNMPPAISGTFQPQGQLNAFNGEPMQGTWTLTVYDDENQDGGNLIGWGLDLCSTPPNDLSVIPSSSTVTSCVEEGTGFTIQLGTAFDETGVTLSANNLPQGASINFAQNPIVTGGQTSVVIGGATVPGTYDIEIVASDALNNNGSIFINWIVNGGPPMPSLVSPVSGAIEVSLPPSLTWTAIGATDYLVKVSTSADMSNVIFSSPTLQPSVSAIGLMPCTEYFWSVQSHNQCGYSLPSAPNAFTTETVLVFNASQTTLTSCPNGVTGVSLTVGECFGPTGVNLSATGLPTGATIDFTQNPALPGTTVPVDLNLVGVAPGNYTINLQGTDGQNNVVETFDLVVNGPASGPVFAAPANGATNVNVLTAFDWEVVQGATNYLLEVATDDDFNNIVFTTPGALTSSNYTLTTQLNVNTTYYWRVTAYNECGSTTPAPWSFTTWTVNSVNELNGLSVSILPNPTGGEVSAVFSKTTEEEMEATLYAVNGVLLKNQAVPIGSKSFTFDLSEMPTGLYLLRLKNALGVLTKKIVLEK